MSMFRKWLISVIGPLAYSRTKQKEKRLKHKLSLINVNANWIPAFVVFEMDKIWKEMGLDAIGTNYFTIGSVNDGLSTRYKKDSPYFQSWLGGYIVRFSKKREWTVNDHFQLGVADQVNWLKTFGIIKPEVRIDNKSVKNLGEISISGYEGILYQGNILSNIDLGSKQIPPVYRLFLEGMVYYFNQSNQHLQLKYENVVPKWRENVMLEPYQKVILKGYIAILNLPENTKAVLYVNGTEFEDLKGTKYHYFEKAKEALLNSLKQIEIKNV